MFGRTNCVLNSFFCWNQLVWQTGCPTLQLVRRFELATNDVDIIIAVIVIIVVNVVITVVNVVVITVVVIVDSKFFLLMTTI